MRSPRPSAALCCGLPLLLLVAAGCGREERARLEEEAAQAKAREAEHRDAVRGLEARRRELQAEADRHQSDLVKAQGRIAELENARRELIQARDEQQARLTAAEKDRDNALAEIQKLTEEVDHLARIVKHAPEPRAMAPRPAEPIRAKVTAVDKKLGLAALRKRSLDLEREQRRLAVARREARERLRAAGVARRADQEAAADPQFLAAQRVLKLLKAEVEARGPGAFPLPEGGLRPAHKALRGKMLAVDNRLGLAVVNVGQREGCERGYEFIVSRRGEQIASVVVIEVFPDLCAARFLKARMKGAVQVGDEAKARPADF